MGVEVEDRQLPRPSAIPTVASSDTRTLDPTLSISQTPMLSPGYSMGDTPRDNFSQGLDFASQLFGSKEAEDFSMFQLQPDLYSGDLFGAGLDQYYDSLMPRGDGMPDDNSYS